MIAFDERGHGDSDKPAGGYTMTNFASDLLGLLDALGIASATLVGHSMGSFVAQRAASTAPHRVERLLLEGTLATSSLPVLTDLHQAIVELGDPIPEDFIRGFQSETIGRPVPEAFYERVVQESLKVPAFVWRAASGGWLTEDRWGDAERMRMPIRIVWGDQDAIVPRDEQDLLAALPTATLSVYEGTGHAIHWEEPERFTRELERFLREARPASAK